MSYSLEAEVDSQEILRREIIDLRSYHAQAVREGYDSEAKIAKSQIEKALIEYKEQRQRLSKILKTATRKQKIEVQDMIKRWRTC